MIPSVSQVEMNLSELLRERTGYELDDLDRQATFMELGFDSLFLIQFSQQIQQRFQTKVAFRQLIEDITSIDRLIEYLASQAKPTAIPAVSRVADPAVKNGVVASPPPAAGTTATKPEIIDVAPPVSKAAALPIPVEVPAMGVEVSTVAASPVHISGIEQIILQQNKLMAQHLALLSGQNPSGGFGQFLPAIPTPATPMVRPDESVACASDVDCSNAACEVVTVDTKDDTAAGVASEDNPPTKLERFGPYKPVRKGMHNGLTDRQKSHLDQFIDRFTRKTARSKALAQTHRPHFADPRGVAGYRRIWKSMVYQIAVEYSKGAHLRDIDGNRYVDIAMGFGTNLFGQSPDFVTRALHEQLDRGVEVGPQSPIAGEVAKMLCGFSRKERVTFCNTGSEAVMAALRLARTVTGKSKFVYFNKDYHGNFDQVLCRSTTVRGRRIASPAAPGVPQVFADNSIVLDYGTSEALRVIESQADEIAAVLIEPVQSADPFLQPKAFLHDVRRITAQNNMAMIMDEVITGFRSAQGGAQESFDVWADMSTYGKILGGGMPFGALAGSRRFMDALDGGMWQYADDSEPDADMTFFAGTFVRHPLGLVAAKAVLEKITAEGPNLQRRLTDRTTYLVETLNSFFEEQHFPIRVAQFASQFRFMFPPDLEFADMLYFHMLDRGVFTRGWGDNCFLSTEHSDEDVEWVIDAIQESVLEIRRGGFFPDWEEAPRESTTETASANETASVAAANAERTRTEVTSISVRDTPIRPVISTLVEIQPRGSKPPLFCTPAADGFTRVYHELSDALGDDQPMYGLDSPGIYGEPIPDTLEKFCGAMVAEIRQVQPEGPYWVIGYCSGGTVALELAQQLIATGEEVAFLGMIETYDWTKAPSTNPTLTTQLGYGWQRMEFHIRNFFLLDRIDKRIFLSSKWDALKIRTRVWKSAIKAAILRKKSMKPKQLVDFNELWRKHDALCESYEPKLYPGKIVHFRPARDYACHLGGELKAADGVDLFRMRAYPAGMMVRPFVAELAQSLKQAIDRSSGLSEQSEPAEQEANVVAV